MIKLLRVWAIVAVMFATVSVGGQAQVGSWVSGFQVVNMSATDPANITVTFYWAEGTPRAGEVAHQFVDQILPGQSKSYYLPTAPKIAGLPEGFLGSAVVTSDQEVAANLNTQLPVGTGATPADPNRVGTIGSLYTASPTLYFTQLMKNFAGWNSYVAIQNMSSEPAVVTITIYNPDGSQMDAQSEQVSPFSTVLFRQVERAELPNGFIGSAVVTGGGAPLAGACNFYNAATSASSAQLHSYRGFPMGAQVLFAPRVVKDFAGFQSGLSIQNVGNATTTIRIRYSFGEEQRTQFSPALGPGQAWAVYLGDGGPEELAGLSGSGAARIRSMADGVPIVATVNGDNRALGFGATYDAFLETEATKTCLLSQMVARYRGYSGGFQVMNAGQTEARVTATFSMLGRPDVTVSESVDSNEAWSVFAPNYVTPDFNGSVVISSDEPIVAVGNLAFLSDVDPRFGMNYGDSYILYTAINR